MPMQQAKSRDHAIDSFANSIAMPAQLPIILSGGDGKGDSSGRENMKLRQACKDPREIFMIANALKNFAQDKVCKPQPLPFQLIIEPQGFRILNTSKVVDPDRAIDDDHSLL